VVAESVLATREVSRQHAASGPAFVFEASQLQQLIAILIRRGCEVLGPVVRDGAVVYAPIETIADLPQGWTDDQGPARYRLKQTQNGSFFGYSAAAQSWKRYLHLPDVCLWSAERQNGTFRILNNEAPRPRAKALLGVRACELAAISVQDRVLLNDRYCDPIYHSRRADLFVIAVACTRAAATCFCCSMHTGPAIGEGADLILTELIRSGVHRFLAAAPTDRGRDLLSQLKPRQATADDIEEAEAAVSQAASSQTRHIDNGDIRELLHQNFEHPRWDAVAARCLTCANCTMVCPTCFCTTVEDTSDVTGRHAERWRRWDSCFTQTFSYIHGGSIRTSAKSRYRQWITHKLAAWIDQFGSSGCVGCGRCITWCPAGIDITEEVRALREGGNHGDS